MGTKKQERNKSEIVNELIAELGKGGFENADLKNLIDGILLRYPENEVAKKLSETLELELEEERAETEYPWILFSLDNIAYGINSKYVLSIEILSKITPIVDAPHYSPGITQSRGEMIELTDMLALFGTGDYRSAKQDGSESVTMMIVTEIGGIKRGLLVDEILAVEHISNFDENIMGNREDMLTSQYVSRIAKRDKTNDPVLILNTENLSV